MGEERPTQEGSSNLMDNSRTPDDMRKSANNWSLSCDADMLNYLQAYSHKMISRTHELQQQLNAVLHESKLTSVRVNSAFNDFIMLANTQFVENRVYDEDVTQENEETEATVPKKEKSKEEREAELIPKISEAMKLGLGVIDSAFEKLDINEANSESEDEDTGFKPEPIFEAKDPYIHRPMPYLIGSQAFLQDDDVGLIDYFSEEEATPEEEEEEEIESESESEEESIEEQEATPRKGVKHYKESDSDTYSDEESDLFGGNDSEDDFAQKIGKPGVQGEQSEDSDEAEEDSQQGGTARDFTSELASKIGAVPVAPPEQKPQKKDHQSKKKDKSKKPKPPDDEENDDDLFAPPKHSVDEYMEDDDSPFGKGGGLFSAKKSGGGLFDDDDEDPFSEVIAPKEPKPKTKLHDQDAEESDKSRPSPKAKTKSGKKVPQGGVPMFGAEDPDDLFSMPSDSTTITTNQHSSKKIVKDQSVKGGLFDGSDEEGDLFDSTIKTTTVVTTTKTATSKTATKSVLFDDDNDDEEEDEGDLFAEPSASKKVTKPPVETASGDQQKPEKSKPQQKLPPGAVSIFGKAGNPLVEALKAKQRIPESDTDEDDQADFSGDDKQSSKSAASKSSASANQMVRNKERSPSLSSNSLFADEPEDLFSSSSNVTKTTTTTTTTTNKDVKVDVTTKQAAKAKSGGGGIFGESDDENEEDLFSITSKPPSKTSDKTKSNTLLFDDEQEDIFATTTKKTTTTTTTTKTEASPKPQKKKPVGGVSLFGGADLFGTSPTDTRQSVSATQQKQQAPSSEVQRSEAKSTRVKNNSFSLFDDNEAEDDGDIFANSQKPKALSTKEKAKSKPQGKSLFEDEDVLFGTKEEDPSVDLFGSTSPLKSKPTETVTQTEKTTKPKHTNSKQVPGKSEPIQPSLKVEGATESSSTTDIFAENEDDEDIFGDSNTPVKPKDISKPKKLPGAVSMFGGMNPSSFLKKKKSDPLNDESPQPTEKSTVIERRITESTDVQTNVERTSSSPKNVIKDPLFGGLPDTEDDLFTSKPTGSGRTNQPPANRNKPTNTAQSSTVSKIQSNLSIDPLAHRPGAASPRTNTEPNAVGFDELSRTETLTSVAKDRPKIQQTRRPPSRFAGRARTNRTGQQSTDTANQSTTNNASVPQQSSLGTSLLENHENTWGDQQSNINRANTHSNVSDSNVNIIDRNSNITDRTGYTDNINGNVSDRNVNTANRSSNITDKNGSQYNSNVQNSLRNSVIDNAVNSNSVKQQQTRNANDNSSTKDIFSSVHKNTFTSSSQKNEGDLFKSEKDRRGTTSSTAPVASSNAPSAAQKPQRTNVKDLFESDGEDDNDIFSTVKPKSSTHGSDDLFFPIGNTKHRSGTGSSSAGSKANLFGTSTSSKTTASITTDNRRAERDSPASHSQKMPSTSGSAGTRSAVQPEERSVDTKQKVESWLEKSEPVVRPSSKSVFEDGDEDIFATTSKPSSNNKTNESTIGKSGTNNKNKSSAIRTFVDDVDYLFTGSDPASKSPGSGINKSKGTGGVKPLTQTNNLANSNENDLFSTSRQYSNVTTHADTSPGISSSKNRRHVEPTPLRNNTSDVNDNSRLSSDTSSRQSSAVKSGTDSKGSSSNTLGTFIDDMGYLFGGSDQPPTAKPPEKTGSGIGQSKQTGRAKPSAVSSNVMPDEDALFSNYRSSSNVKSQVDTTVGNVNPSPVNSYVGEAYDNYKYSSETSVSETSSRQSPAIKSVTNSSSIGHGSNPVGTFIDDMGYLFGGSEQPSSTKSTGRNASAISHSKTVSPAMASAISGNVNDDDLFSTSRPSSNVKSVTKTGTTENNSYTKVSGRVKSSVVTGNISDDDGDLFSSSQASSRVKSKINASRTDTNIKTTSVGKASHSAVTGNISDDDDIFSSTMSRQSASTLQSSPKTSGTRKKPTKASGKAKLSDVSGNISEDDDLFSTSTKSLSKKTKNTSSNVINASDDIFADPNLLNRKNSSTKRTPNPLDDGVEDIFAIGSTTKPKRKVKASPLTDDVTKSKDLGKTKQPLRKPLDDDIFGDIKPKSKTKSSFTIPDIDDIFAGARMSVKPIAPSHTAGVNQTDEKADGGRPEVSGPAAVTDIFTEATQQDPRKTIDGKEEHSDEDDDDDDDLFADALSEPAAEDKSDTLSETATKTKKRKKKKALTKDEDIFKDDTDIFANIPPTNPMEKKTKKKSVFKDLDDDIFADTTTKTTDDIFGEPPLAATKTKTTKKSTSVSKKTKSKTGSSDILNNDAPNIFDDPLNALQ